MVSSLTVYTSLDNTKCLPLRCRFSLHVYCHKLKNLINWSMCILRILGNTLPALAMTRLCYYALLQHFSCHVRAPMLRLKAIVQRPEVTNVWIQCDCPIEPRACLVNLAVILKQHGDSSNDMGVIITPFESIHTFASPLRACRHSYGLCPQGAAVWTVLHAADMSGMVFSLW